MLCMCGDSKPLGGLAWRDCACLGSKLAYVKRKIHRCCVVPALVCCGPASILLRILLRQLLFLTSRSTTTWLWWVRWWISTRLQPQQWIAALRCGRHRQWIAVHLGHDDCTLIGVSIPSFSDINVQFGTTRLLTGCVECVNLLLDFSSRFGSCWSIFSHWHFSVYSVKYL